MKLRCLGSGSAGNCYIIEDENEVLIIEAGVKFAEVKEALDFDFSKVVGLLMTHEHGDHAKFMPWFMQYGVSIYASKGTHQSFVGYGWNNREILQAGVIREIGTFIVTPFRTEHDVAEPLGFIIYHKSFGKLLFCTDSKYLPYKFEELNHILIEANYCMNLTEKSPIRGRVFENHMEITATIDFLKNNNLRSVNNIVLLHLSDSNSDKKDFVKRVKEVTDSEVYVAEKGFELKLSLQPF